jgi:hypothetical protein
VRQVSDIERPADMRRLLDVVAAQMATLAVPGAVAGRMQLPATTVRRYLDLLAEWVRSGALGGVPKPRAAGPPGRRAARRARRRVRVPRAAG